MNAAELRRRRSPGARLPNDAGYGISRVPRPTRHASPRSQGVRQWRRLAAVRHRVVGREAVPRRGAPSRQDDRCPRTKAPRSAWHGVPMAIEVRPGDVFAYDGDEVVGWAAVAPRAETTFARSRTIPHVDDLDVWSVWCMRVRPGHRGGGISHPLLAGAVDYARGHGAPAIEGYPVDNRGEKVDTTMAYVGTRALFERAGFHKAGDTTSVISEFPRVLVRLSLSTSRWWSKDRGRDGRPSRSPRARRVAR